MSTTDLLEQLLLRTGPKGLTDLVRMIKPYYYGRRDELKEGVIKLLKKGVALGRIQKAPRRRYCVVPRKAKMPMRSQPHYIQTGNIHLSSEDTPSTKWLTVKDTFELYKHRQERKQNANFPESQLKNGIHFVCSDDGGFTFKLKPRKAEN